jgi:hypothetical protein
LSARVYGRAIEGIGLVIIGDGKAGPGSRVLSSGSWFLDSVKRVLAAGDRLVVPLGGAARSMLLAVCNGSSVPWEGSRAQAAG